MLINCHHTKIANVNSLTMILLSVIFSLLPINHIVANEFTANKLSAEQYTVSQGGFKKEFDGQGRKKIIGINKLAEIPDQLSGKATAKTREVILSSHSKLMNKANKGLVFHSNRSDFSADFAIYDATRFLQDDYDGDGFYQTFSVIFDADIYSYTENQFGEVYALLYISKNGGPWTHYFTTDTFLIEGDTDLDEYEVITTFLSGYSSDYYDVLIDLYQVGYGDLVATYSSDDSNDLYALPLESGDYDEPYTSSYVEVVEISGGSLYWLTLLLLSAYFIRLIKNKSISSPQMNR